MSAIDFVAQGESGAFRISKTGSLALLTHVVIITVHHPKEKRVGCTDYERHAIEAPMDWVGTSEYIFCENK